MTYCDDAPDLRGSTLQDAGVIAPFVLVRIATLPLAMLDAMVPPATNELVEQILASRAAMARDKDALADALYRLVPRLPDNDAALRRQVLSIRRDLHNGRPSKLPDTARTIIAGLLDGAERAQFLNWAVQQDRLQGALRDLEPTFRRELQEVVRPALRQVLREETFTRALAFANLDVEHQARRERKLPTTPWPDSLERVLLGYVARAAAKTSPFSSFMALAVVPADAGWDGPPPAAPRAQYVSQTTLNRGLVSRLDRAAIGRAARAGAVRLRFNETLRKGVNGRIFGLCNREVTLLGRPWYEQRLAQFRLHDSLIDALIAVQEADWAGWCAELSARGIDPAQLEGTLDRMIERGVLIPDPLADAFEADPLGRLLARWHGSGDPVLAEAAEALSRVPDHVGQVTEGVDADARVGAIRQIQEAEQRVQGIIGFQPEEPLQNHVVEDCWLDGLTGTMGRDLLRPLGDFQDFLSRQVIVSPYYARMRDAFVQQYGVGGVCDDVPGFLFRIADRLIDIPEFGAKLQRESTQPASAGTRIPVTAHVQIAAGPHRTDPVLIPNRVFDGAGWLAARFTPGKRRDQERLRDGLRQWLATVSDGREPVDIVIGGHCSDLQAHSLLTDRVLRWPGEHVTLPAHRIIEARDLRITHDPDSGLLDVTDGAGRPLALHHLGATLPNPIWGVRYALSILTQPYLLSRPDFAPPEDRNGDDITFEPPLRHGSVILKRAQWWAPMSYLQRVWFDGSEAERLVRIRQDCERLGIGQVFYTQRYAPSARTTLVANDVLNAGRKPLWTDIRNPFCISMLERQCRGADWISITEALPGPADLWLEIGGRRHVTELHIEMLVRAAPVEEGK